MVVTWWIMAFLPSECYFKLTHTYQPHHINSNVLCRCLYVHYHINSEICHLFSDFPLHFVLIIPIFAKFYLVYQ